jgi:hypothetical protein
MSASVYLVLSLIDHAANSTFQACGRPLFLDGRDSYVVNNKDRVGDVRWLHLATGKVLGEPGSRRIAFGKWDLCIQGLKHGPSETTLLSHPTQRQ